MAIGLLIGLILGTSGTLLWQRFCCGIDEAFERTLEEVE